MTVVDILKIARDSGCSDVHLAQDRDPMFRKDGVLVDSQIRLSADEKKQIIDQLMKDEHKELLDKLEDADFSFEYDKIYRHRVNVFRRRSVLCASVRIINSDVPSFEELALPDIMKTLAMESKGLVLVTGPTGSGKSTTLAAMVDYINKRRACHILTVEDPVEYVFDEDKSMINQRETGRDVKSFSAALRSALREDPDVIMVGEMRDYETISTAITAAETGHLVLSTLHTMGAANTIDRIVDVFPPYAQQQIRTQLSGVLKGVITQQLVPRADIGGRAAAFEILVGTDAVASMIRDNKCFQLESVMQTGMGYGMVTMDTYLKQLENKGVISSLTMTQKLSGRPGVRG